MDLTIKHINPFKILKEFVQLNNKKKRPYYDEISARVKKAVSEKVTFYSMEKRGNNHDSKTKNS